MTRRIAPSTPLDRDLVLLSTTALTVIQIANFVGQPERSIGTRLHRLGSRLMVTKEMADKILELHAEGMSLRRIGMKMGLPDTNIVRTLGMAGVMPLTTVADLKLEGTYSSVPA